MSDVLKKIKEAFNDLEKRVFVSEADFQHSFAMVLEEKFPGNVRLEYPIKKPDTVKTTKGDHIYADILIKDNGKKYIIELKYKTQSIKHAPSIDDDSKLACALLKDHSAYDFGAYDFWADINRTECLIEKNECEAGVCIFLTNAPNYKKAHENTIYSNFSIEGGTHERGEKKWKSTNRCSEQRIAEIQKTRPDLDIKNTYDFEWRDFLMVSNVSGEKFQCLYLEIPPKYKD
ncbi:MAG: hypothetical protein IJX89_00620 [Alphaproteobacteria bacterium]|nr:hypothetical protein [Alphaproteobacteria bacterium]